MRTIIVVLFMLFTILVGCERVDNQTPQTWLPPDQLHVQEVVTPPAKQTYVLLDVSASNTFRTEMLTEAQALVARIPAQEEVCLLVISSDSRSTASTPWCRGLLEPITCQVPAIKSDDFEGGMDELRAYDAARQRVEQERVECQAKIQPEQLRDERQQSLSGWVKRLPKTQRTDISGALAKAMNMAKADVPTAIYVYSDMVEDLPEGATATTPVLNNSIVHVRLLTQAGAGFQADARQQEWQQRLTQYGAAEVEWKDFYVGEFASN